MRAASASPAASRSGLVAGPGPAASGVDPGLVAGTGVAASEVGAGLVPGAGSVASEVGADLVTAPDPAALSIEIGPVPDPSQHGVLPPGGPAAGEVDAVDALLPQTQCRRCGYDACRPYAEAMVRGEADINRCPPGGDGTISALSRLLLRPVVALDPSCGTAGPRETARIDESECIGCTVCIRACPVDAIIGARKWMHAVLESECTGCGLCVEPCPVDCIVMAPARTGPATVEGWLAERAQLARRRFERRRARESALEAAPHRRERASRIDTAASLRARTVEQRRADIAAAVARVEARKMRAAPGGR